jgi:polysaccharide export outer membrane protein
MAKMHFERARATRCVAVTARTAAPRMLPAALLAALLAASLSGCATPPPSAANGPVTAQNPVVQYKSLQSPVLSAQVQTLTPAEVRDVLDTSAGGAYELGPDDIISVTVYLHPELSVPSAAGIGGGALITGDGTATLPLIGQMHLGGMSLNDAQNAITQAYQEYIKEPKVTVQFIQAQSLSYYLLGAFKNPGVKYPVHEMPLLEALALGGSVDIANADLYQSYVAQGNVKLPIDLHALLVNGDLTQNITLAAGDTIVIPSSDSENAFVFGAVGRPGATPFHSGALSLLQALSDAGLNLPNYPAARLAQIHIIRAHGQSAEYFVVNAAAIIDGDAAPFNLEPGDIVFVPPTLVATWNQVLEQLIPSLQVVSDSLNPFVAIRYLETH